MSHAKKSQRLKPVQEFAEREEQEVAQRYAAVQQQHQQQRDKLTELQQYYDDYRRSTESRHCDLKHLQESRLFLSRLAQAIRQQSDTVARCTAQLDDIRQQWMTARQHSMSMEQLLERYKRVERREQDARDQRESDELSSQRFVWRQRHA